jgi:hypothetical protein
MNTVFINRLDMCRTISTLLNDPQWHPVWKNQRPLIFTEKASELQTAINDFSQTATEQEKIITGHAAEKERNETELEDLGQELGEALGEYFLDQQQDAAAHTVDFPISSWRRLRDEQLLNRSRILAAKLTQALAENAPTLEKYGLNSKDLADLTFAIAEYESDLATPAAAIAARKAQTAKLRQKYQAVSSILLSMDKLVARFANTPAGRDFASTWKAARIIRDRSQPAATPPPSPTA